MVPVYRRIVWIARNPPAGRANGRAYSVPARPKPTAGLTRPLQGEGAKPRIIVVFRH